uniref:THAP-type domain-containing protein n=1 Tax=Dendroctonus ponderosae TaxID=77166 RepID=A0AAR5QHX5_DENPD
MYGSQNKWCFVPRCKNTSISAPNKHFLTVPQEYARKVLWFKAARRDVPNSKSMFFCCEDHFNLEQDMENYVRFKLMGGKILLKTGVIPHIFDCQQDRKRAASAPERSLSLKRERKRLVEEAFCSDQPQEALSSDQPSTNSVEVEPEGEHIAQVVSEIIVEVKSIGVQVNVKPSYRSKYVMCNIQSEVCDTASSPGKFAVPKDVATSPIRGFYTSAINRFSSAKKYFFTVEHK